MIRKTTIAAAALLCASPLLLAQADKKLTKSVKESMMDATRFYVENCAENGGYLWSYSPDFSRRWGELEARPGMIWLEGGTPAMGQTFLDAYEVTGDEYYFEAAKKAAGAIIWAQHPSGGWGYMADFRGEVSLKEWFDMVSKGYTYCAQEHMHYYGNCTYDDSVIYDCGMFLLRMYLKTMESTYREPLMHCLEFVLESQYPVGGWPQRYPLKYDFQHDGKEDYTSFITVNDGVFTNNINFLICCYLTLGDSRCLDAIQRAMNCVMILQGGKPQAGWAMQHKLDLNYSVGHARDFEPAGYAATATAEMCRNLMRFYRWTGNTKYLSRIPDALEFLEDIKYSPADVAFFGKTLKEGEILCPTFAEEGTNRPIYLHRGEGRYWVDYDPNNIITHYASVRTINIKSIRDEYNALLKMSKEEATAGSPLLYPINGLEYVADLNTKAVPAGDLAAQSSDYVNIIKEKHYLTTKPQGVSNENPGFSTAPVPAEVISIKEYMKAMNVFVNYLKQTPMM